MDKVQLHIITAMKRLAAFAHKGQKYGGMSYGYHLDQVAIETSNLVPTTNPYYASYQIVAYGHDLIEDTNVTIDMLLGLKFSSEVVKAIEAITYSKGESRNEYLDKVMKNEIAHKVKIADTLSNLTHSVRDGNIRRISKYTNQLEYLHKGGLNGKEESNV